MTWKATGRARLFYTQYFIPFLLVCSSTNRVDFENLKEIPILVLDVNEDFKNDKIKQEYLIDKVSVKYFLICFSSAVIAVSYQFTFLKFGASAVSLLHRLQKLHGCRKGFLLSFKKKII